jgi:uncharacterized protein YcfL
MKKLFLLALISLMFFSCVDKKEQVQEEVLVEEVFVESESTLVEETETETLEVSEEVSE